MKTTVLEDKLFKMLKDNLADLWQDDLISEAGKSLRNSNPCWKGYHPVGTKKKGGKTVPNCVPSESVAEVYTPAPAKPFRNPKGFNKQGTGTGNKLAQLNRKEWEEKKKKEQSVAEAGLGMWGDKGHNAKSQATRDLERSRNEKKQAADRSRAEERDRAWWKAQDDAFKAGKDTFEFDGKTHPVKEQGVAEDWNKVNHHDKTNGLSQKAVNAYRHEHPGSHLQTAVTTKPSKLKAGSKAAKRRKSFCARMSGNKGPMKKPNGKPTPKALALRRWHCESLEELLVTARQHIYEAEGEPEGLKHLTPHLAKDILDQIETEGVHAIVKSIEWGDGGAKELVNIIKRELKKVANN